MYKVQRIDKALLEELEKKITTETRANKDETLSNVKVLISMKPIRSPVNIYTN